MSLAYLAAALRTPGDDGPVRGPRNATRSDAHNDTREDTVPARPTPDDDAALLMRLRSGDDQAFDTLVRAHASALIAFGHTMLGTREEAEDIVQDVLLWVWDHREQFTLSGSLRTYLLTAVRRRALNVVAHHAVESKHTAAVAEVHASSRIATPDPAGSVDGVDDAVLWQAVRQLPPRWQEGVTLRYVAGLPYAEVGHVLGVSEAAARMLVRRAIDALRNALRDALGEALDDAPRIDRDR